MDAQRGPPFEARTLILIFAADDDASPSA